MLHVTFKFRRSRIVFIPQAPLIRMQSACKPSNLQTGTSRICGSDWDRERLCLESRAHMHTNNLLRDAFWQKNKGAVHVCGCAHGAQLWVLGEARVTQKFNLSLLLLIPWTLQQSDRSSSLEPIYLIPLSFRPPVLSEKEKHLTLFFLHFYSPTDACR